MIGETVKVCFFGSYDKNYARNMALIAGMRSAGFEVIECNEQPNHSFFIRAFKLFFRALKIDFDILWVGYPGHLYVFVAKIICILKRKPLLFDVFISQYDAEIEYGNIRNKKSLRARFLRFLDRTPCMLSDIVFIDTPQQVDFFASEFKIPKGKFQWVPIGADEKIFYPRKTAVKNKKFRVLYYGRTTPLHGLPFIFEAAKILERKNADVEFIFIGKNVHFRKFRDSKEKPKNCIFFDAFPAEKIAEEISKADVCLGIFGTTPKASRVIPNKVFEPLAMGRPVITAKTPALEPHFSHKENVFFVNPGSPKEIAAAIEELKNDSSLGSKIGKNGYLLFKEKFSSEIIGAKIKEIIDNKALFKGSNK